MDGSSTSGSMFGSDSIRNNDSDHPENDSNDERHLNLEGAVGGIHGPEHEDSESDGQRRALSMDDDGGSYFEASAMQNLETVVRRRGSAGIDGNSRHIPMSPIVSDFQAFLSNESDEILFDPAKRLNFDDTTEDEEDKHRDGEEDCFNRCIEQEAEVVVCGVRGESLGKGEEDNSESEDGSSGSNYLDHRPRVNGSDLVEDGAVAAAISSTSHTNLNSVPDQGQNVRIIEGHDSSLQDDDDGNPSSVGGNAFRYNANLMQTQVVNLPFMSSLPSGRSRDDSDENEDGQNLYDSLDPEDGTSPYGGHPMTEHQVLESNTSEYYSAGSLLSLQALTSQQSHVDGDGESFWPQPEVGELSSHLRSSVTSSNPGNLNSFQQESFSTSSHHDPSTSVSNIVGGFDFQPGAISLVEQNSIKESVVGSGGDCGMFGSGLVPSESSIVPRSVMSDSQDGFELCDEGLLHGTQLYAQPMASPNPNQKLDGDSDVAVSDANTSRHKIDHHHVSHSVHHSNSNKKNEGSGRMFNVSGGASNATNSNISNCVHIDESNVSWDTESSVHPNDHNIAGGSNNNAGGSGGANVVRDERQAAAGSSGTQWTNQNQSAKPKATRSTSVPRKRITATTKVQQTRRPAVQGSASREGNNKTIASAINTNIPPNSSLQGNTATSVPNKTGKSSSSVTPSSSAAMISSVRAGGQGGDSGMIAAGFTKNDSKNQNQDVGNNYAVSDGGCRLSASGAGHFDAMSANAPSANSKFSRMYQPQTSYRTNSSYASMSSLTTAANSRVSGVGKESHHSHHRGPAQSNSGPLHYQSSRNDLGNQLTSSGSGMVGNNHPKQQGRTTRPQGVPSNHSLSGQDNVKFVSNNMTATQGTSSHVPQVLSDQDLPTSVNSGSSSSSYSSSHHDIVMSSSQTHQQHRPQQKQQQQPQQQNHLQQYYRQELPNQLEKHQVPVHQSSSNPFLLSPQSPLSPSGSDHSHHSYNREVVLTQMDTLQHRQSARHPQQGEAESGILGMEEVRSHLNSMLNMAADRSISGLDQSETATELLSFDQPVQRQLQFDVDSSSAFNGTSGPEDMSEILENFPTFSSKMFTEMSGMPMQSSTNKGESQSQGENHYLRDNLEKERYRRKHCEQQIQKLNAKLLETQQQLAVAVSTDKRKDLMIEQLDKQLARVVEGWKKREADKDALLASMTDEKEHIEECLHKQQTMINNFEHDLAHTVAELKEEKEKSSETIENLRVELTESRQVRDEIEENLASAADKCNKMAAEWDALTKAKVTAERLAQQTQDTLVEEENKWKLKESDLINKITQVKEANEKVINMEKVKSEEEKKKREDLESECGELKTQLKKIVLDAEQLVREKESQKVEMSIMEAKSESAHRKLEADLHAQMEKEIAEQAKDYHSKLETAMEEMSEKHRKQVAEVHSRHQRDLEHQMATANEETDRKDAEHKKKLDEMEEKLSENRNEISNLKQSKLKLESQRMEILSKLQFMMQSQWNEAVSLLVSTPQKKGLSSSFLSNQSMSLSGMLANAQPTQPPGDINSAFTNGSSGSNSSSLSASLNLASLVMSSSAPPPPPTLPPSSSPTILSATTPSQQTALITSNMITTSSTTTMTSFNPLEEKRKDYSDVGDGSGGVRALMETNKSATLSDYSESKGIHNNNGGSSSNNNSVTSAPNVITNGIYSVKDFGTKDPDRPGSGEVLEMPDRDRAEEYVFRTSDQFTTTTTSPQHHETSSFSVSSQLPMTCVATSDPGSDNSILSAVVHHPSVPPSSSFKATAIKSPCQRSSTRFWNDLGMDPTSVSLEQGSHAPPPSAVNSYSSMHQDDHLLHSAALVVNNNNALQQRRKQQQQQQHQHQQQHELHHQHHHHVNHQPHHSHPPPQSHQHQHHPHRQQQQQHHGQRQQKGKETQSSGHIRPQSFHGGNSSDRDHQHTTTKVGMSPPVKQAPMRREDLEDSLASDGSGVTDPIRLQAEYSHLTDQVDAHGNRQEELQHYIQMLLKKTPGNVEWEAGNESFDFLESSRDLTVDLDLTETGQALEMTRQMSRLQELRERQQQGNGNRYGDGLSGQPPPMSTGMTQSTNNALNASFLSDMGLGGGQVLTPQNLVEISQLLSLYREQWETSPESATKSNTAGQLMDALAIRRSHGLEPIPNGVPDKVATSIAVSAASTSGGGGGGTKNSPRGHHSKKSKNSSSSLSSSTSSGTTKDAFIKSRKKIGYQSADSNLNSSTDSGGHYHGHVGTKSGTSSTGRKGQGYSGGGGKGAPSSKTVKASGHSAWK